MAGPAREPQSGHVGHVDNAAGGPGADELVRTALPGGGDCDMTSQFRIGVDLMIRRLDAYLDTLPTQTAAG